MTMSSLTQFLLVVVISTLTFLVTLVTIQVLHILHDLRQSIQRFNQILSNTKPTSSVNEFIEELVQRPESSKHKFFHRSGLPLRPAN